MSEMRILIVEDEPVIAENIALYLNNNDFKVTGIAYDTEDARKQLQDNTPDAVLLDINLDNEEDGIELAKFINKKYNLPLLFLTSYSDRETLERAKAVESWGYVVKPFDEKALLASLEMAIANFARHNSRHTPVLSFKKINTHLVSQLSEREFEVMQFIYAGKTNQQIATTLFISVNTIKKHINNAYLKLNVSTRTRGIARLLELMAK
ncbi:MAG: response regulator transcription factor [Ferruginibacter sp.]